MQVLILGSMTFYGDGQLPKELNEKVQAILLNPTLNPTNKLNQLTQHLKEEKFKESLSELLNDISVGLVKSKEVVECFLASQTRSAFRQLQICQIQNLTGNGHQELNERICAIMEFDQGKSRYQVRVFGTNQVIKLKEDKLKALEPRQEQILNTTQGLINQIWYAETSVFANPYYEEMEKLNQIYEILNQILNNTQVDVFCKKKLVQATLDMFKNKPDTHSDQLSKFMTILQILDTVEFDGF